MQRKILIVEDNGMSRKTLCAILDEKYVIIEAKNGREAIDILERELSTISAVILDLEMPKMNGFEVMAIMQKNPEMAQIPIIIATVTDDSIVEGQALESGAIDYVTKPYNPRILRNRLSNIIKLREQAASIKVIRKDELTGLYSRAAFFELCKERIEQKEAGYYTMTCFDIDHFKVINDQYGSAVGDVILKQIADVFLEEFDSVDSIISRIMADRFALLYPTDFSKHKKINQIMERASVLDGSILPLCYSMGCYVVDDIAIEPSVMYDRAMIAKESIKGDYDQHIAFYKDDMRDKILREQKIISEMKQALLSNQFEVWYQPQVNYENGALVGAEALVRWKHPEEGILYPNEFVPIFERNGFIYELDKYVWEQACIFLKERKEANLDCVPISVNLSKYDIYHKDLVDYVAKMVYGYQISTDLFRLEISESVFVESNNRFIEVVKDFQSKGFVVEIDNFGSRYSSLNILKDIPASIVKLDMCFMKGEQNNSRGGNIIESVVRMIRWLGLSVIAEGVEEVNQADFLKSIGCNYIQGYQYSRPLTKADFIKVVDSHELKEKMKSYNKIKTYDSMTFWDPQSLDTLIFNSYVGAACVFEYRNRVFDIIRCNEEYSKVLFGKECMENEAIHLNWYQYMTTETKERIQKVIQTAIESKEQITDELLLHGLRVPGKNVYLHVRIRLIAHTDDRYLFYCCMTDITETKETIQREQQLAAQMEIILRDMNSGAAVYLLHEDGNKELLLANEVFYKQRGYTESQYREEIKSVYDIIYPDDVPLLEKKAEEAKKDGTPEAIIYRVVKRDGTLMWVQSRMSISNLDGYEYPVQITISADITAEYELRSEEKETELLMQTVLSNVASGITAVILNGKSAEYLYSNDRFYEILKYTREEFQSKVTDIYSVFYPEDREWIYEVVSRLVPGDSPVTIEFRAVCKDKTIIHVRMKIASIIYGEAEKVIQVSIFDDITEEYKEGEREKELIENLPCGAGIFDFSGSLLTAKYLNKKYWELVGRNPKFSQANTVMEAVKFDDRAYLLMMLQRLLISGKEQECELHLLNSEGEYSPFLIRANVMRQKSGKSTLYVTYTSIAEDAITFRRMLPVALEAMMSSSRDPAYIKDRTLNYVCASKAFANMLGIEDEREIIGKTDYDLFEDSIAVQHRKEDEQLLRERESLVDYVEHMPSKRGMERTFTTSKYILKDTAGSVIGIYGIARDVTEDKEAYKRLSLLTDTIPGGLATFELTKGRVRTLFVTEGIYKILGYDTNYDISMVNPFAYLVDEDKRELFYQIGRIAKEDIPIDCVFRVIRKNGSYIWINLRGAVAERKDEHLIVNTVLFDVNEQKIANEKLKQMEYENRKHYEQELHLRKGLISNSQLFYQVNISTGIIEEYEAKNSKMALIEPGTKLDNYMEEKVRQMIAPEDVDRVFDKMSLLGLKVAYASGEKTINIRYRRKLSDGEYHWVQLNAFFMEKPENGNAMAFLYCNDIDKKERTHLSIATILDEDIESIIYVNVKNGIATIAHMLEGSNFINTPEDFNLKEESVKWCKQMVLDSFQEVFLQFYDINNLIEQLNHNETVSLIYKLKEQDGVHRKVTKAYYLDNRKDYIVLTRRDITQMYEEEARQKKELQKAVDKANKANKAKSDFLAHMSHDLRTPMNAVLAFSGKEMIEGASEEQLRKYMDKVNVSGNYLLGIINDVLDMSRIEQNCIKLNPEPYYLEEFELMIRNMIEELCKKKEITFSMYTKLETKRGILVDHVRFNQIFINLLSNAVKYTPNGGKVDFTIEDCSKNTKEKKSLRFIVKDNGIGMSEDFIPYAFESFSQEYRKDVTEKVQGTGLGLPIVKELVTLMGGTISLKSKINQGSIFTVDLPLNDELIVKQEFVEEKADYHELKGTRILIVEDYELNYEVVEKLLEKYGSIIEWAENGKLACDKFKRSEENYYQMILMDVRMPVMGGLEATRFIREMDRSDAKRIPIIAMSADAFIEDERTAKESGMNAQVTKPIVPKKLYETCCHFLRQGI